MSRTYRRKNYEDTLGDSWGRQGRKQFGMFVKHEWFRYADGEYIRYGWYYRESEGREIFKTKYFWHGESRTRNERSPSKEHRKWRNRENRAINKQEILRFMKNPESYEPMVEENPRDCWWDWS